MAKRTKDPVIVVTGASQGIGAAIARAFAAEIPCVKLALVARHSGNLAAVAKSCAALGASPGVFPCDVSSENAVIELEAAIRRRFGAVDVLVSNAGKYVGSPLLSTTTAQFDHMIAANLRSQFLVIKAFAPAMVRRRRGDIFVMGSVAGLMGLPQRSGLQCGEVRRGRADPGDARRIQGQGNQGVPGPPGGHGIPFMEGKRRSEHTDDARRGRRPGLCRTL